MSVDKTTTEIISKYFQGVISLKPERIQMFQINSFPKPGTNYRAPFASETLTPAFNSTFPVSRLLNKQELVAEQLYIKNIRNWILDIQQNIEKRHKLELQLLEKQLELFLACKADPEYERTMFGSTEAVFGSTTTGIEKFLFSTS
jgi:hypothetical protein